MNARMGRNREWTMSKIKWEKDWKRAFERARDEGKGVFLDFFNPG